MNLLLGHLSLRLEAARLAERAAPAIFFVMLALKAARSPMVVVFVSHPARRRLRASAVARFMRQRP